MLYNIFTGRGDVIKRLNSEIVIIVSSLHRLREMSLRFVFMTGHAMLHESKPCEDLADLDKIDWDLLRSCDFRRDSEDPGKLGCYQAEALVHSEVPVEAFLGIACHAPLARDGIRATVNSRGLDLSVKAVPGWYF